MCANSSVLLAKCLVVDQLIPSLHLKGEQKRLLSLPFCMLTVQGSSKVFLASGQSARVFQVLPKAAEVPSITPLVVLKSSVCTSLKFPQRPRRKQMVCASLLQDDRYW